MIVIEPRPGATAVRVRRRRLTVGVVTLMVVCVGTGGCASPVGTPTAPGQADSFGTRLAFGQHEVFFTPGVEPAAAQKVGEVLIREKFFGGHPGAVQVRSADRRYEAQFVVRAGAETDPPKLQWRSIGETISNECFRGSPVDVHLCDRRLNTLTVIPYEPIRPDLPIRVTLRPSVGGGSLVAQYRNDSAKYLTVVVTLRNPTLNEVKRVSIKVGPMGMTEHGWAEGWSYVSGETITITHAGYEPKELVVP